MQTTPDPTVLVAVDDARTHDAVGRLAALAGVAAKSATAAELRGRWAGATGVVVDVAAARVCTEAALARRPGVLLVTVGPATAEAWRLAVSLGAEDVLELPRQERGLLDRLACLGQPEATASVVCCLPATGGAGSSTLAVALALAAGARGQDVLLLDADPLAGGIELLVGIEQVSGSRWEEFRSASGVLPVAAFTGALPSVGRVRVLSCERGSRRPLPPSAVDAVLAAGRRAHALVIVDAPNTTGEAMSVVVACADTVVVTVAADVRSVAAASALVADLRESCTDIRLVVRQPGPGGLRARDVAEVVGAPVAAMWPRDRKVARIVERGAFARGWRQTSVAPVAEQLLAGIGPAQP